MTTGRQPLADLRQHDLARPAQEERLAEQVFQKLDLVADGGLGHAELLAGAGEAAMPGGGIEHPHRIQRELAGHLHG